MKHRLYFFLFSLILMLSLGDFEKISAQQSNQTTQNQSPTLKKRLVDKSSKLDVNVRGCGEDSGFWVCGRVIDADGKPISGVYVETSSAYFERDSPLFYSAVGFTDKDGYFKGLHYNAKPGAYVISVNHLLKPSSDYLFPTTFYPDAKTKDKAAIFMMDSDESFEPIVFQLPPRMVEGKIHLTVVYEDGSPADQVMLVLENTQHSNYYENEGWITDENGFVEMSVYEDRGYQIKVAKKDIDYYAETSVFDLSNKPLEFKLTLKIKN